MNRAIWALSAALALSVVGCGWQTQNLQGNQCIDGSCSSCIACGNGGLRDRIGDGQLAGRLRAGAQMGPPHVQGDFLTHLQSLNQARHAEGPLPGEGTTPTTGYPYYTIRGPRDFFVNDPMPIGY
ncbi:MAG: hypothetical protein KY475_15290 [Planctomycetes bacterium]|nr:hypothetical protein [Planctomycetota bacterium]